MAADRPPRLPSRRAAAEGGLPRTPEPVQPVESVDVDVPEQAGQVLRAPTPQPPPEAPPPQRSSPAGRAAAPEPGRRRPGRGGPPRLREAVRARWSSPQALREAVVLTELLGPPVSLRRPGERPSGGG